MLEAIARKDWILYAFGQRFRFKDSCILDVFRCCFLRFGVKYHFSSTFFFVCFYVLNANMHFPQAFFVFDFYVLDENIHLSPAFLIF